MNRRYRTEKAKMESHSRKNKPLSEVEIIDIDEEDDIEIVDNVRQQGQQQQCPRKIIQTSTVAVPNTQEGSVKIPQEVIQIDSDSSDDNDDDMPTRKAPAIKSSPSSTTKTVATLPTSYTTLPSSSTEPDSTSSSDISILKHNKNATNEQSQQINTSSIILIPDKEKESRSRTECMSPHRPTTTKTTTTLPPSDDSSKASPVSSQSNKDKTFSSQSTAAPAATATTVLLSLNNAIQKSPNTTTVEKTVANRSLHDKPQKGDVHSSDNEYEPPPSKFSQPLFAKFHQDKTASSQSTADPDAAVSHPLTKAIQKTSNTTTIGKTMVRRSLHDQAQNSDFDSSDDEYEPPLSTFIQPVPSMERMKEVIKQRIAIKLEDNCEAEKHNCIAPVSPGIGVVNDSNTTMSTSPNENSESSSSSAQLAVNQHPLKAVDSATASQELLSCKSKQPITVTNKEPQASVPPPPPSSQPKTTQTSMDDHHHHDVSPEMRKSLLSNTIKHVSPASRQNEAFFRTLTLSDVLVPEKCNLLANHNIYTPFQLLETKNAIPAIRDMQIQFQMWKRNPHKVEALKRMKQRQGSAYNSNNNIAASNNNTDTSRIQQLGPSQSTTGTNSNATMSPQNHNDLVRNGVHHTQYITTNKSPTVHTNNEQRLAVPKKRLLESARDGELSVLTQPSLRGNRSKLQKRSSTRSSTSTTTTSLPDTQSSSTLLKKSATNSKKRSRQPSTTYNENICGDDSINNGVDCRSEVNLSDTLMEQMDHLSKTTVDPVSGLPVRMFSVRDVRDQVFHFKMEARKSGIPNSGNGVFLTFLGAQVLKPKKRLETEKKMERRIAFIPPTMEPLQATTPDGYNIQVKLTGSNLHGNQNNIYWPDTMLPLRASYKGKNVNVKLSGKNLHSDDLDDEKNDHGEANSNSHPEKRFGLLKKRFGLLNNLVASDFIPDNKLTFSNKKGLIDLGRYGPFFKSDRKSKLHFDLKNFIFNNEPSFWSFGVKERLCNEDQFIDVTDDATGEPHAAARSRIPMYVNEVGHSKVYKQNVLEREVDDRNVHYYLNIIDPLQKGDTVELFVDYKDLYEPSRERKGYGLANATNGLRGDDHTPTRLQRNFVDRKDIEEIFHELTVMELYTLVEFIHDKIYLPVSCATNAISTFLAYGQVPEDEKLWHISRPSSLQWIARRRLHWITFGLEMMVDHHWKQMEKLPASAFSGFPNRGMLIGTRKLLNTMKWDYGPTLAQLQMARHIEYSVKAQETIVSEISEEILNILSKKGLINPLDEALWCPIAVELIENICKYLARNTLCEKNEIIKNTQLSNFLLECGRNAALKVRTACTHKTLGVASELHFASGLHQSGFVDSKYMQEFQKLNRLNPFKIQNSTIPKGILSGLAELQAYHEALQVCGDASIKRLRLPIPTKSALGVSRNGDFLVPRRCSGIKTKFRGDTEWYLTWQVVFVIHKFASTFLVKHRSNQVSSGGYSLEKLCALISVDVKYAKRSIKGGISTKYQVPELRKSKSRPRSSTSKKVKTFTQTKISKPVSKKLAAPTKTLLNNVLFEEIIWKTLAADGWTITYGTRPNDRYYIPPGMARGMGFKPRLDFFDSKLQIMNAITVDSRWKHRPAVKEARQLYHSCAQLVMELRSARKLPVGTLNVDWLKRQLEERNGNKIHADHRGNTLEKKVDEHIDEPSRRTKLPNNADSVPQNKASEGGVHTHINRPLIASENIHKTAVNQEKTPLANRTDAKLSGPTNGPKLPNNAASVPKNKASEGGVHTHINRPLIAAENIHKTAVNQETTPLANRTDAKLSGPTNRPKLPNNAASVPKNKVSEGGVHIHMNRPLIASENVHKTALNQETTPLANRTDAKLSGPTNGPKLPNNAASVPKNKASEGGVHTHINRPLIASENIHKTAVNQETTPLANRTDAKLSGPTNRPKLPNNAASVPKNKVSEGGVHIHMNRPLIASENVHKTALNQETTPLANRTDAKLSGPTNGPKLPNNAASVPKNKASEGGVHTHINRPLIASENIHKTAVNQETTPLANRTDAKLSGPTNRPKLPNNAASVPKNKVSEGGVHIHMNRPLIASENVHKTALNQETTPLANRTDAKLIGPTNGPKLPNNAASVPKNKASEGGVHTHINRPLIASENMHKTALNQEKTALANRTDAKLIGPTNGPKLVDRADSVPKYKASEGGVKTHMNRPLIASENMHKTDAKLSEPTNGPKLVDKTNKPFET